MRVFIAMVAVLVATPAWADSFDYTADQRRMDEIEASYPPLSGSLQTRDDVEDYVQRRDRYEQAVQRLTLEELRQMRKDQEEDRERREYDQAIRNLSR